MHEDDFEAFAHGRLDGLLRTATAICGDPLAAEDLVQDVLVKALRHWHHIQTLEVPDAYLRRMLVNEFISAGRRRSAVPVADPPERAAVADDVGQVDDRHALAAEVKELPRKQQAALALRYWADLSDAQIADALGCRPGTVRGYISRALATLRLSEELVAVHHPTPHPPHTPHPGGAR